MYVSLSCCSVAQLCLTPCDPTICSMPGFPVLHYLPTICRMPGLPVLHYLPEFAQTHVHWVGDAIQPSHPLSSPSPSNLNLSQHQGLFQWVSSLHQEARVFGSKAPNSEKSDAKEEYVWVSSICTEFEASWNVEVNISSEQLGGEIWTEHQTEYADLGDISTQIFFF